jgi:hypothetical protein
MSKIKHPDKMDAKPVQCAMTGCIFVELNDEVLANCSFDVDTGDDKELAVFIIIRIPKESCKFHSHQ